VTLTLTIPAVFAGETAVIVVEDTTVKEASVSPNKTLVAPVKLVPVIVTVVPPIVGPLSGESPVIIGAGACAM
jgi:hypothetical protein